MAASMTIRASPIRRVAGRAGSRSPLLRSLSIRFANAMVSLDWSAPPANLFAFVIGSAVPDSSSHPALLRIGAHEGAKAKNLYSGNSDVSREQ